MMVLNTKQLVPKLATPRPKLARPGTTPVVNRWAEIILTQDVAGSLLKMSLRSKISSLVAVSISMFGWFWVDHITMSTIFPWVLLNSPQFRLLKLFFGLILLILLVKSRKAHILVSQRHLLGELWVTWDVPSMAGGLLAGELCPGSTQIQQRMGQTQI